MSNDDLLLTKNILKRSDDIYDKLWGKEQLNLESKIINTIKNKQLTFSTMVNALCTASPSSLLISFRMANEETWR